MREDEAAFWQIKRFEEMSREEWESLCDGCGRCCLHRVIDEDDEVWDTRIACELLDTHSCRCTDYPNRRARVPGCLQLTPHGARTLDWLPDTCAYRLLANGEPLRWWHPLVSGDPETVHVARISARGQVVSEREVDPDDWEDWLWLPEEEDAPR